MIFHSSSGYMYGNCVVRRGRSPAGGSKLAIFGVAAALAGCSSFSATGPSSQDINSASKKAVEGSLVKIVDLDQAIGARLDAASRHLPFSQVFGDVPATSTVVGAGDQLSVQIWEAPPAVLFGTASLLGSGSAVAMPSATSNSQTISSLVVEVDGSIPIPFVGRVRAAGRSPAQIASDIRSRLLGKAHDPQVVVTMSPKQQCNNLGHG